jgi:hypothetical protein
MRKDPEPDARTCIAGEPSAVADTLRDQAITV